MRASGTSKAEKMAVVSKSGLMVRYMRATGKMTKQTEEVVLFMLMVTYTTVIGKTIKHMVMEFTTTLMVLDTKDGGLRTSSMVRARKSGLTTHAMKVSIKMARNTVTESSSGLMVQLTLVILLTTTSMDKEFTLGQTVVNTMVSGTITRCMAQVFSPGMMAESTKVNTLTTKSRVREFSLGPTVASTKVNGKMESSTA
jgi:hypothetical protein